MSAVKPSRSTMILVVSSLLIAAGAMGGIIYVLVGPPTPQKKPEAAQVGQPDGGFIDGQCDPEKQGSCPQGNLCVEGECVPYAARTKYCGEMDACGGCICAAPMGCVNDRCRTVEEDEKVCKDERVMALLRKLDECQGKRKGKDAGSCTAADWEDYAIQDTDFDRLMASFYTKISLHFWTGAPQVTFNKFDPNARTFYLSQIRQYKTKLDKAQAIFVIGRASRGGYKAGTPGNKMEKDWNKQLGLNRMDFAARLLLELYAASNAPAEERDALGRKIVSFGLGDQKPIDADYFFKNYMKTYIMWEQQADEKMRAFIDDPGKNAQWALNTMNQMTVIIPVPCELTPPSAPAH